MSRRSKFERYVHWCDELSCWVVAQWKPQRAEWQVRYTPRDAKKRGGIGAFSKTLEGIAEIYSYRYKSSALRQAKKIYGEEI